MIFTVKNFYMDSISHESTHAVIGYFARKLKDMQDLFTEISEYDDILGETEECEENEELFCYMVGSISDQIVANYNRNKKDTE